MLNLWHLIRAAARRVGHVQGLILLSVIYYVVIGPVALVTRSLSDPLRLRPTSGLGTYWRLRDYPSLSLEQAKSE